MNLELKTLLDYMKIANISEYQIGARRVDHFLPEYSIILEADGSVHYKDKLSKPKNK